MFGAMFRQEMRVAGRRARSYFLRWIYAALLLAQLVTALKGILIRDTHQAAFGVFAAKLFASFLPLHFAFILMLTPALTAAAITEEKTRGTLTALLTSRLRPMDIVLGKLLARTFQIALVTWTGLPLVVFFGTLGDFDSGFVPAFLVVSTVLTVTLAAVGLLASVWCRQTRDAMLATYLVVLAGAIVVMFSAGCPWAPLANDLHPGRAVALDDPAQRDVRLARFAAAWLLPAAGCLLLATLRCAART